MVTGAPDVTAVPSWHGGSRGTDSRRGPRARSDRRAPAERRCRGRAPAAGSGGGGSPHKGDPSVRWRGNRVDGRSESLAVYSDVDLGGGHRGVA